MATRYINSKEFWLKCMEQMYSTTTPPLIDPATGKPNKTHPSYKTYSQMSKIKNFTIANGYGTIFGPTAPARTGFDSYSTYSARPDAHAHMNIFRGPYATTLLTELGITSIADFNALVGDLNSDTAGTRVDNLFAAIDSSTNPSFATTTQKSTAKLALFSILSEVDGASDAIVDRNNKIENMRAEGVAHTQTAANMRAWFGPIASTLPLNIQNDIMAIITATEGVNTGIAGNVTNAETNAFADDATFDPIITGNRTNLDNTVYPTMYRTYAEVQASTASPKPPLGTVTEKLAGFYFQQMQLPEDQRTWQGLRVAMDARGQAAFDDAQAFVDSRMENFNKLNSMLQGFTNMETAFKNKYLGSTATLDLLSGGQRLLDLIAVERTKVSSILAQVLDIENFKEADIQARLQEIEINLFRTQEEASIHNKPLAQDDPNRVPMGAGTELVTSILFATRSRFHTQEEAAAFRQGLLEDLKTAFPYISEERLSNVIEEAQAFVDSTSFNLSSFRLDSLLNENPLPSAESARIQSEPTFQFVTALAEEHFPYPVGITPPGGNPQEIQQIQQIDFQRLVFARETLKFNADVQSQEALLVLNEALSSHIDGMVANGTIYDIQNLNAGAVTEVVREAAIETSIAKRNMVKTIEGLKVSGDPRVVGKSDEEIRAIVIADAKATYPAIAAYSDDQVARYLIAGPANEATRNALRTEMYNELSASLGRTLLPDEAEKILSAEETEKYIRTFEVNGQIKEAHGDFGFAEMNNEIEATKNFEFDQLERRFFGFTPCGNPNTAYYRAEASRFAAMTKPGGLAEYYLAKAAWRAKWNPAVAATNFEERERHEAAAAGVTNVYNYYAPVDQRTYDMRGATFHGDVAMGDGSAAGKGAKAGYSRDGDVAIDSYNGGKGGSGGGKGDPKPKVDTKLKYALRDLYLIQDSIAGALRDEVPGLEVKICEQTYREAMGTVLARATELGLTEEELAAASAEGHSLYLRTVKNKGIARVQSDDPEDVITLSLDGDNVVLDQGIVSATLSDDGKTPDVSLDFDPAHIGKATTPQKALFSQDVLEDYLDPSTGTPVTSSEMDALKTEAGKAFEEDLDKFKKNELEVAHGA